MLIALPESFLPFDLEVTWSSALVVLLTDIVAPSLLKEKVLLLNIAHTVLDEMIARGNLIAKFRKAELQQLDAKLKALASITDYSSPAANFAIQRSEQIDGPWDAMIQVGSAPSHTDSDFLREWDFEDPLSGEQLAAVADSFNPNSLDWLSVAPLDQLNASLL